MGVPLATFFIVPHCSICSVSSFTLLNSLTDAIASGSLIPLSIPVSDVFGPLSLDLKAIFWEPLPHLKLARHRLSLLLIWYFPWPDSPSLCPSNRVQAQKDSFSLLPYSMLTQFRRKRLQELHHIKDLAGDTYAQVMPKPLIHKTLKLCLWAKTFWMINPAGCALSTGPRSRHKEKRIDAKKKEFIKENLSTLSLSQMRFSDFSHREHDPFSFCSPEAKEGLDALLQFSVPSTLSLQWSPLSG